MPKNQVDVSNSDAQISVRLVWIDKTSTRLPEALWLRFGAASNQILAEKVSACLFLSIFVD